MNRRTIVHFAQTPVSVMLHFDETRLLPTFWVLKSLCTFFLLSFVFSALGLILRLPNRKNGIVSPIRSLVPKKTNRSKTDKNKKNASADFYVTRMRLFFA